MCFRTFSTVPLKTSVTHRGKSSIGKRLIGEGHISGTKHIRETVLDITGTDISGIAIGNIRNRHIGEINTDISGTGLIGEGYMYNIYYGEIL